MNASDYRMTFRLFTRQSTIIFKYFNDVIFRILSVAEFDEKVPFILLLYFRWHAFKAPEWKCDAVGTQRKQRRRVGYKHCSWYTFVCASVSSHIREKLFNSLIFTLNNISGMLNFHCFFSHNNILFT